MLNTVPDLSLNSGVVHVVVGVIERSSISNSFVLPSSKEILISKRAKDVHQGGLWEFPGGKVEANESAPQALSRELFEELGITVSSNNITPLIQIEHDYGDKKVFLDVYTVYEFQGGASGKEGQPIKWVNERELLQYSFPEANRPILSACRLPKEYIITPEYLNAEQALKGIDRLLKNSAHLFLFRQPGMSAGNYQNCISEILDRDPSASDRLMLSGGTDVLNNQCAAGIHMPFRYAEDLKGRPVQKSKWFGVSCHNSYEIERAEALGADFITLSPVLPTATHPEASPLGWEVFQRLVQQANIPVYALGGMMKEYQQAALRIGAQGVAGIRLFCD